ncbi:MAG TPA: copper resistance CopC family protein [Alphaproteobacteria bacterium]|nr:copper resistance CopC family protein [Alphaproteobacteria bacterium]
MRFKHLVIATCLSLFLGAAASAHAFLDHASPPVGSTVAHAPATISLWFTEKLEPTFSTVEVYDSSGARVDLGSGADPDDATVLRAKLKPLPPGVYKVVWRVVSIDTHATNGDFTFRVTGK